VAGTVARALLERAARAKRRAGFAFAKPVTCLFRISYAQTPSAKKLAIPPTFITYHCRSFSIVKISTGIPANLSKLHQPLAPVVIFSGTPEFGA